VSTPPGPDAGPPGASPTNGATARFMAFCQGRKLIVFLLAGLLVFCGLAVAPFDWTLPGLFRSPVPVDAIPDIGENQQIVFTEWTGRSPQDVEDQVSYPLTSALLGVPGVKTVRSASEFGFSTISVIFEDDIEFYFGRTRILEKLSSLPKNLLPADASPQLGPDATGLGQVFWYTLEGVSPDGRMVGGFDPQELRTLQEFTVRCALQAADGVSEVASIGGFVREYQVDVDPLLLQAYGLSLAQVVDAVRRANLDVGARTLEVNRVEYLVRGLGFIRSLDDLRQAVVATRDNVPITLDALGTVGFGPALRLGALDRDGHEAVGGVVTARFGANPLQVIKEVKERIRRLEPALPSRTLADGTVSRVRVVPFYDRATLIGETLGTLDSALLSEVLVTVVVVLVMVANLGSALLISALLPLAVLASFIAMKLTHVDANIVALAGIAIAIGTMVDMGIILVEAILRRQAEAPPDEPHARTVLTATREVGGAVLTALSTTVVSFLPIFAMVGQEGKLFRPLAFTKTYALLASLLLALALVPPAAELLLRRRDPARRRGFSFLEILVALGLILAVFVDPVAGLGLALVAGASLAARHVSGPWLIACRRAALVAAVATVLILLARHWLPLGPERSIWANLAFIALLMGAWLGLFALVKRHYGALLGWCLGHRKAFLAMPAAFVLFGLLVWLGVPRLLGWLPAFVLDSAPLRVLAESFPGLAKEFMPPLDEGSYLLMPTTMPHASIGQVAEAVRRQDAAIAAIPEVAGCVGKLGRADTALDPAPVSMIETVVNIRPEYLADAEGRTLRFRYDPEGKELVQNSAGVPLPAGDGVGYYAPGRFARDAEGRLIPDERGRPFRLWRPALDPGLNPGREPWPEVGSPDDIWALVTAAARLPGLTSAPKLQPISARLVMLESGIRAAMAVIVSGPDLIAIQEGMNAIEGFLREVKNVAPGSVIADRIVAKPYLEIAIDRPAAAQYGLTVQDIQEVIEAAVGGRTVTTTVEGRERYPVRVRYARELRDDPVSLGRVLLTAPNGSQVPLSQVAAVRYAPGPTMIKGQDAFPVGYVIFDAKPGVTAVQAVEDAARYLGGLREAGILSLPEGVSYAFTGTYENHLRASRRLAFILPLTLALVFLILHLHFARASTAFIVFSGVGVAWAGGFAMLWLYGQGWFMDFSLFGANLRELFRMHPLALSLPVWVGFLALFGISTDDGVVMATYLDARFAADPPSSAAEVRRAAVEAGLKRIRPCLMTTATTVLALLPLLSSRGRGADLLVPMAIPPFGGMVFVLITMFVVPVLYAWREERRLAARREPEPAEDRKRHE